MAGSIKLSGGPEYRAKLRALGLVAPLLIFIVVTFVAPLGTMLLRSVYDPVVANAIPETLELLEDWDGTGTPARSCICCGSQGD